MSTYKLYYFDGRGRAEVSRLLLTAAGQKFEDVRYQGSEWPAHKAEMPLGQVPVLEADGVKIVQSMVVARFLARQLNLAGKDNLDQAKADAVADTATDLLNKFGPLIWSGEESERKGKIETFLANDLPAHLKNLETLAKAYSNGGAFFVGNQLTIADLNVFAVLDNIVEAEPKALDQNPWLKANREEVAKNPKIAAYLQKRQKTPF